MTHSVLYKTGYYFHISSVFERGGTVNADRINNSASSKSKFSLKYLLLYSGSDQQLASFSYLFSFTLSSCKSDLVKILEAKLQKV